ncbi:hypothetical protein [Acutalibacter sp. JLR.KK004]|jgi:hypothetical protein|uniref:hypothetical protein n=1 Tax=Acutalibacter sp. JLR.KK004 TaxID=3112622 RepID=UPI00217211B3|nr:hypothetical protein [Acutalibacter sp.]
MADIHYTFSEAPVYHTDIRRFQNTDPVNAETVVNPVIQRLIDNIHALYLGKADAETLREALESVSKAMEKLDMDVREYVQSTLRESLSGLKKGEAGGVAPLGEDGKVPNDYINAQGGLVAQEEPPENTTLGWIDTANGNILKFYRDGDWISVSAVWG